MIHTIGFISQFALILLTPYSIWMVVGRIRNRIIKVNEIFEKIALANLLGSDKKVRVTIEYDPNYEDFLLLVTDT